jgi:uncharacterized protein YjbI with pentapeptide repeats
MRKSLRSQHPNFCGNWDDLEQFLLLAQSPIRSEQRENALHAWSEYKLHKQFRYVQKQKRHKQARYVQKRGPAGKLGKWAKGDYVRSLTAPAIDLRGATLRDVCVGYADFRGVRFDDASFVAEKFPWIAMKGAKLQRASLRKTRLTAARLIEADLRGAELTEADLAGADLKDANLADADLRGANLRGANLERANLVRAKLQGTNLSGSRVYGVSAWDIEVDEQDELRRDLIVTPSDQPDVTTDNIEIAQFVYLLLDNPKIRGVIDTVCKKGVLILGRFIDERKSVLDEIREALRKRNYVPMVFDFKKPTQRDLDETVKTLAGLCRFIIADITNPRSSPMELQAIVPDYMVPLVPIIAQGEKPFAMFKGLWIKYRWVLDPLEYSSIGRLVAVIEPSIIEPALKKHAELLLARAEAIRTRRVSDYEGG